MTAFRSMVRRVRLLLVRALATVGLAFAVVGGKVAAVWRGPRVELPPEVQPTIMGTQRSAVVPPTNVAEPPAEPGRSGSVSPEPTVRLEGVLALPATPPHPAWSPAGPPASTLLDEIHEALFLTLNGRRRLALDLGAWKTAHDLASLRVTAVLRDHPAGIRFHVERGSMLRAKPRWLVVTLVPATPWDAAVSGRKIRGTEHVENVDRLEVSDGEGTRILRKTSEGHYVPLPLVPRLAAGGSGAGERPT